MKKAAAVIFLAVIGLSACQTAQVGSENAQPAATEAAVSTVSNTAGALQPAASPSAAATVKAVKTAKAQAKAVPVKAAAAQIEFKAPESAVPEAVKQLLGEGEIKAAEVNLTAGNMEAVQAALGNKAAVREKYQLYSGKAGVVVIEEQQGKWGLIKTAVLIDPAANKFLSYAVLSMSEKRGAGIKAGAFIKQFAGKSAGDTYDLGAGITAASGATISSKAMVLTVKRALVVYDLLSGGSRAK